MSGPSAQPRIEAIYRLAAATAFGVMRAQRWRFDVEGLDNVPSSGGAVIAANHTSYWDFFAAGRGPYRELGRPVRILAKASLFDAPVFGRMLAGSGHIPVRRTAGGSAYAAAVDALRNGELVLVLPEQTISPSFELMALKPGAVRMAARAQVPLVPAVSWGTHRFHTVGRRPSWSWKLPVSVAYGAPLHPTSRNDTPGMLEELRRRLASLLDATQRRYADGLPEGAWWVPARLGGSAPNPGDVAAYLASLESRWRSARSPVAGSRRRRNR